MSINITKRVVAGVSGAVVVVAAAMAFAGWEDWYPSNIDATIELEHNLGYGGPGPTTILKVHRGAASGGSQSLQFDLTIAAEDVLSSAVLETCTDTNSNGVLDPAEWSTAATASISQSGGLTTASTPTVTVSTALDGYRVRYLRSDIGETREIWKNNPEKSLPTE